jgi:branched-subunit amino acid aminotransferase/4-amino-4-deoxychorismate lyase
MCNYIFPEVCGFEGLELFEGLRQQHDGTARPTSNNKERLNTHSKLLAIQIPSDILME